MTKLLKIDVSPRGDWSVSRKLGDAFLRDWQAANPDGQVVVRDLAKSAIRFVDLDWIVGAFSPKESRTSEQNAALALSDELIAEVNEADHILISTPMFNYSTPAILKAWLDQVVRTQKTFSMGEDGVFSGILKGKKATVVIASAGFYSPENPLTFAVQASDKSDFEKPYLKHILAFIGVDDVEFVEAGGTFRVNVGMATLEEVIEPVLPAVAAAARR